MSASIRLGALVLLAACAGRAAPNGGDTSPPPVLLVPEPGEGRLRNIRQLTSGGNNAEAYFSGSGRQIIFQRQERLEQGCDQQYIMNADGTGLRRVSSGLGRTTCGYFYDRDRRILYSSTFAHDPGCPPRPDQRMGYVWLLGHFEIYSARPDGSDLGPLTTTGGAYNAEATVSPDGKTIIFTSTRDGDLELYTMASDGSKLRRITHRVGYDGGAFFSPDGKRIVWRAGYPQTAADSADYLRLLAERLVRPSRVEIWVANADGSDPRQVTRLGGANFAPFFAPDGKRIIFSSNYQDPRSGRFDLYLINDDGTGLERVTTHPDFDSFPMFSPDGRKLLWVSNRNGRDPRETNIFMADWVEDVNR